ncbi:hypothetical protein FVE85_0149 [Porphyridium purpureum]|uniref:Uncharacterized protein n=1 Tax=Porphyridium purpureum TaxID=35688 RepID=A0A5J4YZK0_PORPP|nr:hypothetical protein FVE85_0149 [Porphyridium purpureum]|eukprot:POR3134..scf208_2
MLAAKACWHEHWCAATWETSKCGRTTARQRQGCRIQANRFLPVSCAYNICGDISTGTCQVDAGAVQRNGHESSNHETDTAAESTVAMVFSQAAQAGASTRQPGTAVSDVTVSQAAQVESGAMALLNAHVAGSTRHSSQRSHCVVRHIFWRKNWSWRIPGSKATMALRAGTTTAEPLSQEMPIAFNSRHRQPCTVKLWPGPASALIAMPHAHCSGFAILTRDSSRTNVLHVRTIGAGEHDLLTLAFDEDLAYDRNWACPCAPRLQRLTMELCGPVRLQDARVHTFRHTQPAVVAFTAATPMTEFGLRPRPFCSSYVAFGHVRLSTRELRRYFQFTSEHGRPAALLGLVRVFRARACLDLVSWSIRRTIRAHTRDRIVIGSRRSFVLGSRRCALTRREKTSLLALHARSPMSVCSTVKSPRASADIQPTG